MPGAWAVLGQASQAFQASWAPYGCETIDMAYRKASGKIDKPDLRCAFNSLCHQQHPALQQARCRTPDSCSPGFPAVAPPGAYHHQVQGVMQPFAVVAAGARKGE